MRKWPSQYGKLLYKYHEKVEKYRIEMDNKNLQKPKAGVG